MILIAVLPRPLLVLPVTLVEVVVDFLLFDVVRELSFLFSDSCVFDDDRFVFLEAGEFNFVAFFPVEFFWDLDVEFLRGIVLLNCDVTFIVYGHLSVFSWY